jgi:hypothetical protein
VGGMARGERLEPKKCSRCPQVSEEDRLEQRKFWEELGLNNGSKLV